MKYCACAILKQNKTKTTVESSFSFGNHKIQLILKITETITIHIHFPQFLILYYKICDQILVWGVLDFAMNTITKGKIGYTAHGMGNSLS